MPPSRWPSGDGAGGGWRWSSRPVLPPGARVVVEVDGDQVVLKPTDGTGRGPGGPEDGEGRP
ncbi:MAG: hypothetical protein ACJ75N_00060 [Actinomycetes bacterium]